jgi:hypothetical protein
LYKSLVRIAFELSEIRRQKQDWRRGASIAFVMHKTSDGLDAYAAETWARRLQAERESETWNREKRDIVEVPGLTPGASASSFGSIISPTLKAGLHRTDLPDT